MNRNQKILGFIAIGLFFISVLAAPWRVDFLHENSKRLAASYVIYNPLFSAPVQRQEHFITVVTLLWQPLVFTWLAIAIAYAGLFFSCAQNEIRSLMHIHEVRPCKDHRGFDLISDALSFWAAVVTSKPLRRNRNQIQDTGLSDKQRLPDSSPTLSL